MRFSIVSALCLFGTAATAPFNVAKHAAQSIQGQPIDGYGKGGPILGGTNAQLDLQNPDNWARQSTDAGNVPNLKWSFSNSKTKIFNGGWTRTQVIQDLPQSIDSSAAQQHLKKGAFRELHWHRSAEWGFVYAGSILVSAVNETGQFKSRNLAMAIFGLDDENGFLLAFDEADFDKAGTTFMVDDWLAHTPRDIITKNFGVDPSVFANLPTTDPYIFNGTVSKSTVGPSTITGNASYVYHTLQHPAESVPGGGGEFHKIDSTNFPIAKTLAATFVTLKPGGLRELHWHPNAQEWLHFHKGYGRATVFTGGGSARTFDFIAGDTAVFPDNSGHYIENTSATEDLVWIEMYKSDRVADIPLTQ
ncbi:hypothetical protein FKW77_004423 [Venturia effusa]|uniref:Cupin type-1 domain-containing protein n=1 Tax=Venturia effusa TaxID=50376 RepID=A0A517L183_9PEZI|nr:hypothetical protein FKW77_004423 [Venturia effusa]